MILQKEEDIGRGHFESYYSQQVLHNTHHGIMVKLNSIVPDRTFFIAGFNVTVMSNVLFVLLI